MKPSEVASLVNIDSKTIRRYIHRGILTAESNARGFDITVLDAELLQARILARKTLERQIKELFVLRDYGTPLDHIKSEYGLIPEDVSNALFLYHFERQGYLEKFGLDDTSDLLLVQEVTARLKVVDPHIPYELAEQGALELHCTNWKGKDRFFPSRASFEAYLGDDIRTIFYNSKEVSDQLGVSVHTTDRIALSNGIGRKLKPGLKQTNYLFTPIL